MVQFVIFIIIIAVAVFIYLKNKQENRAIDRKNRLAQKQEELFEMLKEKNKEGNDMNIFGVIVGKAIYEGRVTLKQLAEFNK